MGSIRAHTNPAPDCINHRKGASCPVANNICNRQDNIYKATISTNSPSQDQYNYIGMCAPQLRLRVATHQQSFKKDINQTVLSTKVKQLEASGANPTVEFVHLENRRSYSPEAPKCGLCTAEAYQIMFSDLPNLLNSKNEIINKCRHRAKFKLSKM